MKVIWVEHPIKYKDADEGNMKEAYWKEDVQAAAEWLKKEIKGPLCYCDDKSQCWLCKKIDRAFRIAKEEGKG